MTWHIPKKAIASNQGGLVLPHLGHLVIFFIMENITSRYWTFTINNPDESMEAFAEKLKGVRIVKFFVFQHESGERTGTPHYQGYVGLSQQRKLSWCKRHISRRGHFEIRRGTHEQAVDYVTKEETRVAGPIAYNLPDHAGQGSRSDLTAAVTSLRNGGLKRLADEHPDLLVRYPSGFARLTCFLPPPPRPLHNVTLLYGPTGIGKTRWAMDKFGDDIYKHEPYSHWFDGYFGQRCFLLDEFDGWLKLSYFLSFLDRYPHRLQIKNGFQWLTSSEICITANVHPFLWYQWTGRESQYDALIRRIHDVVTWRDGTPVVSNVEEKEAFFARRTYEYNVNSHSWEQI